MFLESNKVDVFLIRPERIFSTELMNDFCSILTDDEINKINRYKNPVARKQKIITRASLRYVLSEYVNINPKDIVFNIAPKGRPTLGFPCSPVDFSVSHTHGLVVLSVSCSFKSGVDVEYIDPQRGINNIVNNWLSANDAIRFQALSASDKTKKFYEVWTVKESFAKAYGKSLSFVLKEPFFDQKLLDASQLKTRSNYSSQVFYPDDNHCMALTVLSKSLKKEDVNFFDYVPLVSKTVTSVKNMYESEIGA